mgnify:CR=1 FL=1
MPNIVIDISELRSAYGDKVKDLEKLLKEKVKAKIEVGDREITLTAEKEAEIPEKDYVRVLLKKFLHRAEIRSEFRVIAGQENQLMIKERRITEETE